MRHFSLVRMVSPQTSAATGGCGWQGALDIIRAATSLAEDGQSDEIELDFDTLDSATLWKLEGYLRSLNPVAAGNGNFNVQVCCFCHVSALHMPYAWTRCASWLRRREYAYVLQGSWHLSCSSAPGVSRTRSVLDAETEHTVCLQDESDSSSSSDSDSD